MGYKSLNPKAAFQKPRFKSRVYGSVQKPRVRNAARQKPASETRVRNAASEMPQVRNAGHGRVFTDALSEGIDGADGGSAMPGWRRSVIAPPSRVTVERSFCTDSYGKTADSWNIEKWSSTAVSGSKARCDTVVRWDARLFSRSNLDPKSLISGFLIDSVCRKRFWVFAKAERLVRISDA